MYDALHTNPQVMNFIERRGYNGFRFQMDAANEHLTIQVSEATLIDLLATSKLIPSSDAETVTLKLADVLPKRHLIRQTVRDAYRFNDDEDVDEFEGALARLMLFIDPEVKQRVAQGRVIFGDLPAVFSPGMEVVIETSRNTKVGGILDSIREAFSFGIGRHYVVRYRVVIGTSQGPRDAKVVHRILHTPDFIDLKTLSMRPIEADEKDALTTRGARLHDMLNRTRVMSYIGNMHIALWIEDQELPATGRVMVDPKNCALMEPDIYRQLVYNFDMDRDAVPDETSNWRCHDRVIGFSIRSKRWGWLDLDRISETRWRTDAFDNLVLDPQKKFLILRLVENYGRSFTDFVDEKAGGLVFLLHGPSGVGKTLTAEAVAETLRRPLYPISAGELGTTPTELEKRLKAVQALAHNWNAIILLDEADVYMEERDTHDVERNALVSVFLRTLEYFDGVMLLTTNRVQQFDKAFFSRIALAIHYETLTSEVRQQVWQNVLASSKVDTSEIDIPRLAERYDINGRNIKMSVRMVQTIWDKPTTQNFIDILEMASEFDPRKDDL